MSLQEVRVGIKGSWITNQFLDPTNQKLVKYSFFTNCFFQNFKIISTDNVFLFICLELSEGGWTMKEQNSINYVVMH